jgi:hypothetical protein
MKKNTLLLLLLMFYFGGIDAQIDMSPNLSQNPSLSPINTSENLSDRDSSNYQANIQNRSQSDCDIGNDTDPGFGSGNFGLDFLLGVKFTLAEEGTLNSINMIGNNTGSDFQMAVYDDAGGAPNNLVSETGVGVVGIGIITLNVVPVVLPPGDYWIMAVYAAGGNHSNVDTTGAPNNQVFYTPLPFGDPIPPNATGFLDYFDQDFLYFLDISCTLGLDDNLEDLISVYPNPAVDVLNVSVPSNVEVLSTVIYDSTGKISEATLENGIMNTSTLAAGFYILNIKTTNGSVTKKFIKK